MHPLKVFFALAVVAAFGLTPAAAQGGFGEQGAEAEPYRLQQWLVPSPDPDRPAHAVLFRPLGEGPFPLALIAHASTENVLRRAQMPQPEYRALSAWLVARVFAFWCPTPGHGATGGIYLESRVAATRLITPTWPRTADGRRRRRPSAQAILSARGVVGHSAGAWGALALASEDPKDIAAIVAFAPGRGGHANDFPNRVCAPHTLMAAAGEFGKAARVKVTWLVAANDSYFSPALSRQLVDAFRGAGGKADFHVLPAYGSEGHWLVETEGGVKLAASELDRALKARFPTSAKKR